MGKFLPNHINYVITEFIEKNYDWSPKDYNNLRLINVRIKIQLLKNIRDQHIN